jgi:SOS-response transcriptional repressor LexA
MRRPATERNAQILAFIEGFWRDCGYSPSVREVMNGVGLSSPAMAYHYLRVLEARGLITRARRDPGMRARNRTITLLPRNGRCPVCGAATQSRGAERAATSPLT